MSLALAHNDPFIGQVIASRYVLRAKIGSGGMGAVYRAEQLGLERDVAIKVLKPEVALEKETITRFHREAKAMSMLVHPNTVRVFDFGQTKDGVLYLAMELLEGEILTRRLERDRFLSGTDAIHITIQILASLHEAHARGIVHRDLKPDNIYLARIDGHNAPVVKLLDFGIAKVFEGENRFDQLETQAGTVFGTPRYMSPEQATGRSLDPRSDLYGVGILLYQMLTGVVPFADDDAVVIMAKHIRERPKLPSVMAGRPFSPELEQIVMRALEKKPDARFQSTDDFRSALESCKADPDTKAYLVSSGKRFANKRLLWAIPLLVFVATAVTLAALKPTAPEPPAPVATAPATTTVAPPLQQAMLHSTPTGANVYSGNVLIGQTPLSHSVETPLAVRLELDGFVTTDALLQPGEVLRVALQPQPPATVRRRPRAATMATETASPVTPSVVEAPTMTTTMARDPYSRF